jgi:anti-sigma factor RsiW
MGKAEDERLQRYFDGELPEADRAAVEQALTDDDRLKLAALAEGRGLGANALAAAAGEVDLWAGIDAQLRPRGAARAGGSTRTRRWGVRAHPASWSAGLMAVAAAALLLVFQPWHPAHAQNGCEIENLDTYGAVATVINIEDAPHHGDEPTTVIFTTEDD